VLHPRSFQEHLTRYGQGVVTIACTHSFIQQWSITRRQGLHFIAIVIVIVVVVVVVVVVTIAINNKQQARRKVGVVRRLFLYSSAIPSSRSGEFFGIALAHRAKVKV
jgi:hypothetical protein